MITSEINGRGSGINGKEKGKKKERGGKRM